MKTIIREICQRDLIDVNNLLQDVSSFHAKPSELDSWYYDYLNDKIESLEIIETSRKNENECSITSIIKKK